MLVARRFRHILQYAQTLLNRPLPARRKLLPLRRQIIPDMILLFRRQPAKYFLALFDFLSVRRRKVSLLVIVLDDLSLLLRTQILKFLLWLRSVSQRRPVRIDIWRPHQVSPIGFRTRGTI